jgi:hypothetical protein
VDVVIVLEKPYNFIKITFETRGKVYRNQTLMLLFRIPLHWLAINVRMPPGTERRNTKTLVCVWVYSQSKDDVNVFASILIFCDPQSVVSMFISLYLVLSATAQLCYLSVSVLQTPSKIF